MPKDGLTVPVSGTAIVEAPRHAEVIRQYEGLAVDIQLSANIAKLALDSTACLGAYTDHLCTTASGVTQNELRYLTGCFVKRTGDMILKGGKT